MTSTTQPEERLRTDVLGRVQTPRERREQIVDEFERSGVSGVEFARLIVSVRGQRLKLESGQNPEALVGAGMSRLIRVEFAEASYPVTARGYE